jgi:UDP-glucose 4-epimerase
VRYPTYAEFRETRGATRRIPNKLMPQIAQVTIGRRAHLNFFGNDYHYPTPHGIVR